MLTPGDMQSLLKAHWREVYSVLVAITRDAGTAEDLSQEVFVVAFNKGLAPGPGMRQWLKEVARRLAMNELRRKRPQVLDPAHLEALGPASETPNPSAADRPFDDRLAALRRCLDELHPSDRAVLAARYSQDVRLADLAERFRQSVGYLKQRLFRLRRRLADCLHRRLAGFGSRRAGIEGSASEA